MRRLHVQQVDVWALPSQERLHAAIGQEIVKSIFSADPGGRNTSGIIMSLGLFYQKPSDNPLETQLALICAYENGSIVLRRYTSDKETSVEGVGWQIIWASKVHTDSGAPFPSAPLSHSFIPSDGDGCFTYERFRIDCLCGPYCRSLRPGRAS